ncbi:MAG: CO dehydrogenase/acetyl-CoA synthase complex subunit epsilon [Candidatus Methanofastidiosia archaeon]
MTLSYFKANVPGPKTATVIPSKAAAKLALKAQRPIFAIGSYIENYSLQNGSIYEILAGLSGKVPLMVAPSTLKKFLEVGTNPYSENILEFVNKLKDIEWKGFDSKGNYDLVIYLCYVYYLESQMLSTLKHFSSIKTLTVGKHYQPNATFSFTNLKPKKWEKEFLNFSKEVRE